MQISDNELSERELEILRLISTGVSNKQIAQDLHISVNTVKVHLRNIFAKIGVSTRTEAAMYAVNAGLTAPALAAAPELIAAEAEADVEDIIRMGQPDVMPAEETAAPQRRNFWLYLVVAVAAFAVVLLPLYYSGWLTRTLAPTPAVDPAQLPSSLRRTWDAHASMPTARSGLAAAVDQNLIYVVGGQTEDGPTNVLERYNTSTKEWLSLAPKPTAVYEIGAGWLGGKIYVPGGRLSETSVDDKLEIYDPVANTWSQGAKLPEPRSAYALALFEGQIYLLGGWDGHSFRDTIYSYNPAVDQWKAAGKLPSPRGHAGAVSSSGRIFVLGGYDGRRALRDTLAYRPGSGKLDNANLEELAPMPVERYSMGVASIADFLFVVGGIDVDGEGLSSLEYFQSDNLWQPFEKPAPTGVTDLTLVATGMNIYALGGRVDGRPTNRVMSYQAFYTLLIPIVK